MKASLLPVLVLVAAACGGPFAGETDTVVILFTGDLHSALVPGPDDLGGLARIAGYAGRLRSERPDVLLLDTGDVVGGTPLSSLTQGRAAFTPMSLAGYDAMAIGNHEFDYGAATVEDYRRVATFPLLAANVARSDGGVFGDAPYVVLDADGVRVAVAGILWDATPDNSPAGATEGLAFSPPEATLAALVPEMRARADLVVVLSHQGLPADRALAGRVAGVDVILGGHSHSLTAGPERVDGALIVHTGEYGRHLGRLDLAVRPAGGGIATAEWRLLPVDQSFPVDRDVATVVNALAESVRGTASAFVMRAARALDETEVRAVAEEAYRAALGADLGYQNETGVRAGLRAGEVTVGDIWNALPFDNTLVTLGIRGRALPKWARERLATVERERLYTVATTAFVAAHAERHFPGGVETSTDSGRSAREAVIEHLRGRSRP